MICALMNAGEHTILYVVDLPP